MKELISIAGGVTGGALSNGIKNVLPSTANPMLINGVMAIASGFAATKVDGFDGKTQFLKAALIGAAVVSSIGLVKNLSEKAGLQAKLENPTKINAFFKGFTGLGCPAGELNGIENGLYGYEFENGLNAFDDMDGLNAYDDEPMLLGYEDDGLNAYDDESLNGYEDDGLNAYDEDGLNGYEEQAGLFANAHEKEFIF